MRFPFLLFCRRVGSLPGPNPKTCDMNKILCVCLFAPSLAQGQFSESFSDGDFTAGPAWSGMTASWQVVPGSDAAAGAAGSQTLRLNVAGGSGTQYLSTRLGGNWGSDLIWGFWIGRRAQAATSANVLYLWLYASEPDVTSATVDGYRIRFGDDAASGDRVVLELVTNGIATPLITSSGAVTNGITDYGFLVRVTRDASGGWKLFTSALPTASGAGALASDLPTPANTSQLQGSASNTAISQFSDGYLAFAAQHTTAAAARTGVEFDQLSLSSPVSAPLPVRFIRVSAAESGNALHLQWTNATETDVQEYEVERSSDGHSFQSLHRIEALRNDGGPASYSYTDGLPPAGLSLYRIRARERDGQSVLSAVLRIERDGPGPDLQLYPNPVRGNRLVVTASRLPRGKYILEIWNGAGQSVRVRPFVQDKGLFSEVLELDHWPRGSYFLRLKGGISLEQFFVVQ